MQLIHRDLQSALTELHLLQLHLVDRVWQEPSGRCSRVKLVLPGPTLLLTSDNIKQRLGSAALDRYLPSLLLISCERMQKDAVLAL